jgi:serine/threonine protein kinase
MAFMRTIRGIGSGLQGEVSLCELFCDNGNSEVFALKTYKDSSFAKEKLILSNLVDCPHVIKMKSFIQTQSNQLPLVYYCNGELFEYMEIAGAFNERLAKTLFRQCLLAIRYMHSKGIVHRDIKPENIFVDENFHICIGDFGLSYITVAQNGRVWVDGKVGTPIYMAPEVVNGYDSSYCGMKADIWSLGCLLFVMLTGNTPFGEYGASENDWFFRHWKSGKHSKFWSTHQKYSSQALSTDAMAVLEKMFHVNQFDRINVDELLQEPWLNEDLLDDDELRYEMSNYKARIDHQKHSFH